MGVGVFDGVGVPHRGLDFRLAAIGLARSVASRVIWSVRLSEGPYNRAM
jgi:hypothetical protein